jgi:hypothetical protein
MPLRPPDAEMPAEYWESVLNDPQVAAKPGVPIQQRRLADLAVSTYVRFAQPAQPVDATQALNLSAGVSNCKVSRGRSFS